MRKIRVRRGPGVWLVEDGVEVRAFVSGSEAERWGRDRAQELAAAQGEPAEFEVFDLSDRRVGSLVVHPRLARV
jgi:hypothetical protein